MPLLCLKSNRLVLILLVDVSARSKNGSEAIFVGSFSLSSYLFYGCPTYLSYLFVQFLRQLLFFCWFVFPVSAKTFVTEKYRQLDYEVTWHLVERGKSSFLKSSYLQGKLPESLYYRPDIEQAVTTALEQHPQAQSLVLLLNLFGQAPEQVNICLDAATAYPGRTIETAFLSHFFFSSLEVTGRVNPSCSSVQTALGQTLPWLGEAGAHQDDPFSVLLLEFHRKSPAVGGGGSDRCLLGDCGGASIPGQGDDYHYGPGTGGPEASSYFIDFVATEALQNPGQENIQPGWVDVVLTYEAGGNAYCRIPLADFLQMDGETRLIPEFWSNFVLQGGGVIPLSGSPLSANELCRRQSMLFSELMWRFTRRLSGGPVVNEAKGGGNKGGQASGGGQGEGKPSGANDRAAKSTAHQAQGQASCTGEVAEPVHSDSEGEQERLAALSSEPVDGVIYQVSQNIGWWRAPLPKRYFLQAVGHTVDQRVVNIGGNKALLYANNRDGKLRHNHYRYYGNERLFTVLNYEGQVLGKQLPQAGGLIFADQAFDGGRLILPVEITGRLKMFAETDKGERELAIEGRESGDTVEYSLTLASRTSLRLEGGRVRTEGIRIMLADGKEYNWRRSPWEVKEDTEAGNLLMIFDGSILADQYVFEEGERPHRNQQFKQKGKNQDPELMAGKSHQNINRDFVEGAGKYFSRKTRNKLGIRLSFHDQPKAASPDPGVKEALPPAPLAPESLAAETFSGLGAKELMEQLARLSLKQPNGEGGTDGELTAEEFLAVLLNPEDRSIRGSFRHVKPVYRVRLWSALALAQYRFSDLGREELRHIMSRLSGVHNYGGLQDDLAKGEDLVVANPLLDASPGEEKAYSLWLNTPVKIRFSSKDIEYFLVALGLLLSPESEHDTLFESIRHTGRSDLVRAHYDWLRQREEYKCIREEGKKFTKGVEGAAGVEITQGESIDERAAGETEQVMGRDRPFFSSIAKRVVTGYQKILSVAYLPGVDETFAGVAVMAHPSLPAEANESAAVEKKPTVAGASDGWQTSSTSITDSDQAPLVETKPPVPATFIQEQRAVQAKIVPGHVFFLNSALPQGTFGYSDVLQICGDEKVLNQAGGRYYLAKGGNGKVFHFAWRGKDYAIKKTSYRRCELELSRWLSHPNLVEYCAIYLGELKPGAMNQYFMYYVMPKYRSNLAGELGFNMSNEQSFKKMAQQVQSDDDQTRVFLRNARTLVRQVLQGLEYLHQSAVSHNDLKLDNILVKPSCNCEPLLLCSCGQFIGFVIADFDAAIWADKPELWTRQFKHKETSKTIWRLREVGTRDYRAPERIGGAITGSREGMVTVLDDYNPMFLDQEQMSWYLNSGDIYSFGVLFSKLCNGNLPSCLTGVKRVLAERFSNTPPGSKQCSLVAHTTSQQWSGMKKQLQQKYLIGDQARLEGELGRFLSSCNNVIHDAMRLSPWSRPTATQLLRNSMLTGPPVPPRADREDEHRQVVSE